MSPLKAAASSITVAVLCVSFLYCASALSCYECDSSAGDATCLQNTVKSSWQTTQCSNKIPELDFEIRPSAVRCVHVAYTEDNVRQVERKCGFQGLCELLTGLNEYHILGNVTDIQCHTCDSNRCNLYANPRKIIFQNNNNL